MKHQLALSLYFVLIVVEATSCATHPKELEASESTPRAAQLDPYGPLFTTTVQVGRELRTFLVDTGGGMSVLVPELAAAAGCQPGVLLTGFRMSAERIDAPRCEGATLSVGGWTSAPHTVLLMDINKMLPPDWPRLDGLLSLATFDGHVVTVDVPGRQLIIDDVIPANAREVRVRFERSVTGLALGAFIATHNSGRDFWIEVDTGSDGAVILNTPLAALFGMSSSDARSPQKIDLHLDDGAPVPAAATTRDLRFDGNIGLSTMSSWALTFDLAKGRAWFRTSSEQ
jgi:hypothetical protein